MKNYEEIWLKRLEEVKEYIDEYKKTPSTKDKDNKLKSLGKWFSYQKGNYKTKTKIMSNTEIYKLWTEFINDEKYKKYFI